MMLEMADMVDFSTTMLSVLADFLSTPPIFYLFGLVCLLFVIQAVKILLPKF